MGSGGMDRDSAPQHPCMQILQSAFPVLEAVTGSATLQADEGVFSALCQVTLHAQSAIIRVLTSRWYACCIHQCLPAYAWPDAMLMIRLAAIVEPEHVTLHLEA